MNTFLVLGGTGKVGGRLTRVLRRSGNAVRVASRTTGDVLFDWHKPESFRAAFDGVDGVFIVGPGSATDWSGILTRVLDIAHAAGVKHAVFLSARGVEFLPDGAVARAERALIAGPVAWTILRPTHFAQNFTEAMFVPQNDVVMPPVGSGAEPFVDAEDIALVAAEVLTGEKWLTETIEISGPEAVTFEDAVTILGSASGRSLRFQDEPLELYAVRLREAATPEGYITWRLAMLEGIRQGQDAYLSDGIQKVLGRQGTSFSDWAAREAG
ncbi:MAG TPA: NAD(P)H-binding protein [Lacisediminihabitans sp.]|uniref:NmrA family NAD(P)-binding protein n=1 Tax=Lacisediminihabitans sp. TaxID=2787631 RepID=UPI002ED9E690